MNVYRENKDAIVTTAESRDLLVFSVLRESRCSECNKELWKGDFLFNEGERGLCMNCADLDELVYLPSGDAALTRRARKYSPLWAVVPFQPGAQAIRTAGSSGFRSCARSG